MYNILDKTEENLLESLLEEYHRLVRPKGSQGEPAAVSVIFSLSAINSLVSYILSICFVIWVVSKSVIRCGSRIWSRGGPASEAESCRHSRAYSCEQSELSVVGVQGLLEFLMLKYAFSHILEPLFLSFLISTSRPKNYNYY